jgi:hypothetical protein
MIFYVAHGPLGTCGPGCSEWIAAEGAVQWDSFKRLIALADRLGGRKLPVVLNIWGEGSLNVATTLGRIIRDRGLDASLGVTNLKACREVSEDECFALKRGPEPVEADISRPSMGCDVACVLILAGGVHRTLPADTKVVIQPTHIRNRLSLNVSREHEKGLKSHFGEQFRIYLKHMGVSAELMDIIEETADSERARSVPRDDWLRLHIVTDLAL